MRILHVTNAYPPHVGGLERYVRDLVKNQSFLGDDVQIITSNLPDYGVFEKNVLRLPVLWNFKGSWGELPICPTIFNALKGIDCDIIHCHAPSKFFLESTTIVRSLLKKRNPLILTYHLHNESLTYYRKRLWSFHNRIVMPWIFENSDKIIVLTEQYKTLLKDVFQTNLEKIEVVPPGVNDEIFDPEKFDAAEIKERFGFSEENILLFMGRLTDMKGVAYLIQAFPVVLDEFSDSLLIIVGDGELKGSLKILSQKLGVDSHVRFMGHVSDEDVPRYLSAANVLILPSIAEGFGLTLLEAMSMMKPIVATNVGGIRDVVINGKTGFLVEPKNVQELAQAIITILADKKLAAEMGRFSKKLVKEKYNWNAVAQKIKGIYIDSIYERANS